MTKQKGKETNNGQQNACYTDNYPHQNLTHVFRDGKHFLHTTSVAPVAYLSQHETNIIWKSC
jgi:hypothetical protein